MLFTYFCEFLSISMLQRKTPIPLRSISSCTAGRWVHSLSPSVFGGKVTSASGRFPCPTRGRVLRAQHPPGAGTLRVNSLPGGAAPRCQPLGSWQAPLETPAPDERTEMAILGERLGRDCLLGSAVFTSVSSAGAPRAVAGIHPEHARVSFAPRSLPVPAFGL